MGTSIEAATAAHSLRVFVVFQLRAPLIPNVIAGRPSKDLFIFDVSHQQ